MATNLGDLMQNAAQNMGGPMQLPYDPVAVADYVKKKRALGQVPLFTDDPKLAAKEDGFFIDTGTGAAPKAHEPSGYQINKTGNPYIDKYNEAKLELFKHKQAYDADVAKALEATPQARNLATLNRQLAITQSMGMMADPKKVQEIAAQLQIAEQAYKLTKENFEANPIFAQRKQQLDMFAAQIGADEENIKFQEQQRNDQARADLSLKAARKAENVKAQLSPELTQIHSEMSGLPNDPEAVAKARLDGTITEKEESLAIDINEGRAQPALQYTMQGDPEAGAIMSRYAIANAAPDDRSKLKAVADTVNESAKAALDQAAVEANKYLTGQESLEGIPEDSPLANLVNGYNMASSAEAKKDAAKALVNHLYMQKVNGVVSKTRKDIVTSNPEILRPAANWTAREAEIGNKIVDIIRNSGEVSFDDKLSTAVSSLADSSIYGVQEINDTVKKMGEVYVRRFNEEYGDLGLYASAGDMQIAQFSLLTRILNSLGIKGSSEFAPDKTGTVAIDQKQAERYVPQQRVTLEPIDWQAVKSKLQFGPKLNFPPAPKE